MDHVILHRSQSVYCFQTKIWGISSLTMPPISLCFQTTKSRHTYLWANYNIHHFRKQKSKPGKKQVAFMTNTFCKLCRQ